MRPISAPAQSMTHAAPQAASSQPLPQMMPQAYYPPAARRGAQMLQGVYGFVRHSVVFAAALVVIEKAAPNDLRPSVMLGQFSGSVDVAEIETKQPAMVALERELGIARAEGAIYQQAHASLNDRFNQAMQYAYQMETIVVQAQQQAVAGAQGAKQTIAGLADFACLWGRIDPESGFQKACGAGDAMRQDIASELSRTVADAGNRLSVRYMSGLPDPAAQVMAMRGATMPPAVTFTQPVAYR